MREHSGLRAMANLGTALMRLSAVPGRMGAWIIFVLVLVVLFAVVGAQLSWSQVASWGTSVPLFGSHLSMTGVGELQWHLFALAVMLAGAYTMQQDQHIRVDVVSAHLSIRARAGIDLIGDVFLLLPFFGLLLWFSLDFVAMSHRFAEQSNSGGLLDRYLIKSVLPLGCGLILLCAVGRIVRNAAFVLAPALQQEFMQRDAQNLPTAPAAPVSVVAKENV